VQKQITAIIEREGNGYVSLCPQLDIASQGDTIQEARENLREALELFFEVRRAEPWTGSAECYGSVASIRRITSLYPPYNSSLVGGLRLKERKAKSKGHSFLVRSPTRRSRGRGVMLWLVFTQSRPPAPLSSGVGLSLFMVNTHGR